MTASAKQIEANRRNAQKSTGPRTAEGKAISGRNALKHGVLSDVVLAQKESEADFHELLVQLEEFHTPQNVIEIGLVEKLALLLWRERRLASTERNSINAKRSTTLSYKKGDGVRRRRGQQKAVLDDDAIAKIEESVPAGSLDFETQLLIGRYQTMLNNQIKQTLDLLRQEQALRPKTIETISETITEPENVTPELDNTAVNANAALSANNQCMVDTSKPQRRRRRAEQTIRFNDL